MTDIEIARKTKIQPIIEIAKSLGINEDFVECYGKDKAKIDLKIKKELEKKENGKLILVTSINPTPLRRRKNHYVNWYSRWFKKDR